MLIFCQAAHAGARSAQGLEDFGQFLTRFAADKEFAMNRTIYPYPSQYLEYGIDPDGNDEPRPVRSTVSKEEDAHYPALRAYMEKNGMRSQIAELKSARAVVKVFKPDTDWLMEFYFRREGNCWFMTEFQNHSL